MSTRYSVREVESIVKHIEVEAKQAGLIPPASWLTYHPGNTSQGISGYIDCMREDDEGYHSVQAYFLPKFNYKQSKTDHAKLLGAVLDVFFAFRRLREEKEREVKQRIKEFGI